MKVSEWEVCEVWEASMKQFGCKDLWSYCARNVLSNSGGPVTMGGVILYFILDHPTRLAWNAKIFNHYYSATPFYHVITNQKNYDTYLTCDFKYIVLAW